MRRIFLAVIALPLLCFAALAGDAGVKMAQGAIDAQIDAFLRDDNAAAYEFAAPSIKRMFPTVESFMAMVTGSYRPVQKPRSFAFGRAEEVGATVVQQVLLVGPDGKDYEAVYTLERQPDGSYKITGVSLKASNSMST